MGTEKRERQKAQRQEKIAAIRQTEVRTQKKRRGLLIGGGIAAFVLFALVFSLVTDDGGDDEVATDSTSTTPDETEDTDPTDTSAPAVEITGTPPTTVATADPVEPTCPAKDGSSPPTYDFTASFPNCLEEGVDYSAVFTTTKGEIVVDLREDEVPNTVNNFVALARYHYYDGTDLFRTDPSIDIIQGGGPHTQTNSDPGPGYTIEDEGDFDDAAGTGPYTYAEGQLIMARTGAPDSSSAQFFFSTGPNVANLDSQGTYLLFGDVTEGLDLLKEIIGLHVEDGVTLGGRPSEYVIVEKVEIVEG